jgi:hypothetical protein
MSKDITTDSTKTGGWAFLTYICEVCAAAPGVCALSCVDTEPIAAPDRSWRRSGKVEPSRLQGTRTHGSARPTTSTVITGYSRALRGPAASSRPLRWCCAHAPRSAGRAALMLRMDSSRTLQVEGSDTDACRLGCLHWIVG